MNSNTRACVAVAARSLATGDRISGAYDHSRSRHCPISGTVRPESISLYDHDRRCHFSGSPRSLYDFGTRSHVSLTMNGTSFSGYDFGSRSHFSGTISGRSVSIYDFGESKHFAYGLQ